MFDIGWSELTLVALLAIIVIGPRDLPKVLYTLGRWTRRARQAMHEIQSSIEEVAHREELEELKKEISGNRIDLGIDPSARLSLDHDPSGDGQQQNPTPKKTGEENPTASTSPQSPPEGER